jgi:phage baseplate assembly protein W
MIIKTPFSIAPSGKVAVQTDLDKVVSQKIKDVLLTNQFERNMDQGYGANSEYLVFENYDSLVFEEFKMEAINALKKNVSGATIVDMTLETRGTNDMLGSPDSTMYINVKYKLPIGGVRSTQYNLVTPTTLTEESPI